MSTREVWQRRLGPLYGGAVALVSSTPWRWPTDVADDARSPGWIVALGVPIGLAAWLVAALARGAGLPDGVAVIFGLAMLTVASAAIVERGLGEQVLAWQEDPSPRLPVAPLLALVFTTLIRAVAIQGIAYNKWWMVFVAMAVTGRWAAVFLQALGDPVPPHDEARRSLVATQAPAWLTAAISAGAAVIVVVALGKAGVVAMALSAIAAFLLGLEAQRREGGLSAPVVATAAAIGEMLVLLVAITS
ncbi:MAG: hypothetical protein KF773_42190 [Deltaproteobacteria bacterium]|nr:hypothetical protein [Deltaproteobacteria bacterium]